MAQLRPSTFAQQCQWAGVLTTLRKIMKFEGIKLKLFDATQRVTNKKTDEIEVLRNEKIIEKAQKKSYKITRCTRKNSCAHWSDGRERVDAHWAVLKTRILVTLALFVSVVTFARWPSRWLKIVIRINLSVGSSGALACTYISKLVASFAFSVGAHEF